MKKCWLFSSHTQGLGAKPSVLKAVRYARCAIRFLLPQHLLTGALPLQWSGEWDLRLWPSLSGLAVWAAISACIWIDCLKYWEELIPTEFCRRQACRKLARNHKTLPLCLSSSCFLFFFLSEPHRHFLFTWDIQAKIEWSPSIRTMSLIIENRLSLTWLYLKIFLAHFYSSEPSMDGNLDNNWIFQKNNLSSGNLCPQQLLLIISKKFFL